MATSSIRSRRRPGAKARNIKLIDRLRRVKTQPIDPKLVEAIVDKRALTPKEAAQIERQIQALLAEAEQVTRTRADLAQVPALPRRGSVLL
jgi:hypothetical protein